jgi:phage-related protein
MARKIAWVRDAEKEFRKFPVTVQRRMALAIEAAAEGETADIAKPMKGLGSGVFEIALPYRSDAYRAVYAVKLGDDLWIIHAFQKKSKRGVKTPKQEIDLIRARIKAIRERHK